MGIFTPIVPLEFDASFSYIQRLVHLCEKLNEQGVSINSIQEFLNSLDIDKKIKDEVFKQFVNTPNLKTVLEHRKILIIGDSYLYGSELPSPETQNYGALIKARGYDVTCLSSPGGGFGAIGTSGTFKNLLENYTGTDKSDFTDIFILGGINDTFYNMDQLPSAVVGTVNTARSIYPNAKIQIGYISQSHRNLGNIYNTLLTKQIYKTVSNACNCAYINNSEYMLKFYGLLVSDGVHPTTLGQQYIANYLISYIENGNISTQATLYHAKLTQSAAAQVINPDSDFNMIQKNNIISIAGAQPMVWKCSTTAPPKIELSGRNALEIGNFTSSLIFGQSEDNTKDFSECEFTVPATITLYTDDTLADTKTFPIALRIDINGLTLNAFPMLVNDTGSNFFNSYIKQINIAPFNATINADLC